MSRIRITAFITSMIFVSVNSSFAEPVCPNADAIKHLKLVEAIQHQLDPDVWNFASAQLEVSGQKWNIWFGTFLPNVINAEDALQQGQIYFNQAEIIRKNPSAYPSSRGYFICDYIPEGALYWISAVNPPAYGTMP